MSSHSQGSLGQQRAVLGSPRLCGQSCSSAPIAEPVPTCPRGCPRHPVPWFDGRAGISLMGVAEGQAFVLLGEQGPLSCPQVIQSAGESPCSSIPRQTRGQQPCMCFPRTSLPCQGMQPQQERSCKQAWSSGTAAQTSLGKGSGPGPGIGFFHSDLLLHQGSQGEPWFKCTVRDKTPNRLLSLSTEQLPGQVRAVTITLQLLP